MLLPLLDETLKSIIRQNRPDGVRLPTDIAADTCLAGFDHIAFASMAIDIEDQMGFVLAEEDLRECATAGDVWRLMTRAPA